MGPRKLVAVALSALSLLCALGACSAPEEQKAPAKPKSRVALQVVHGASVANLLGSRAAQFNMLGKTLGDGSVLSVELIHEPDVLAAQKIARGDHKVDGWLVGPASLVPYVSSRIRGLGARQGECAPLFSSPVVLALRKGDVRFFSAGSDSFSWADLIEREKFDPRAGEGGLKSVRAISHEHPDISGVGLSALVQLALSVRAQPAADPWKTLAEFESLLSEYDTDYGAARMAKATKRAGIAPAVLTLEQQVVEYNQNPAYAARPLVALYPKEGSFFAEYQLCISDAAWVTPAKRVGLRMFSEFMQSGESARLAAHAGFRASAAAPFPTDLNMASLGVREDAPTPALIPPNNEFMTQLLAKWPETMRPAAVVYILDSSSNMFGEAFERVRAQLRRLIGLRRARDQVALVSLSFNPKVEAPLAADSQAAIESLDRLSAMGGATILDGIRAAYKLLKAPEAQPYRKVIVLVSAGADSNSAASVEEVSDDLFTEMMVKLHIVSLTKLPAIPPNAAFPLKAFAAEEQVDYREVDYNALEFALEDLSRRL